MKDIDAEELRVRLLEQYGVGVIAEGDTDIRIAFSSLEVDEIPDLFDIMYRCAVEMTARGLRGPLEYSLGCRREQGETGATKDVR